MGNILSKKIGIIGGGQLGKMMIAAAKQMGFWVAVLDPAEDCPCHSISDMHIVASMADEAAIRQLSTICDVITYESEHINADALIDLEKNHGALIYPSPESLKIIQNKFDQKTELHSKGVAAGGLVKVDSREDMSKIGENLGYPFMLKSATGGYDGKGNYVVASKDHVDEAYDALGAGKLPLMAERFVDYAMEISVIACRAIDGEIKIFPVGRNTHVNSVLDETLVPAPISGDTVEAAMEVAHKVMEVFKGVGIFCIEMFVDKEGKVSVNEVAPRPHNSGHYSIEACVTSQFEQHIRAITALPLGDTTLIRPAVMRNLLGEDNFDGKTVVEGVSEALAVKGAKLHIYGKTSTKPRRKMGHITVTAETVEEAAKLCSEAKNCIRIITN